MPVHDWTRVESGPFHHFHQGWIIALSNALNAEKLLPPGYSAFAEQVAGGPIPDILTLQRKPPAPRPGDVSGVAVAMAPPPGRHVVRAEMNAYVRRANHVAIRHGMGRVVAIIEIVSPGNKDSRNAIRAFVEKAVEFLRQGIHLLIIDLFPPTKRDPSGIHKAIWDEIHEEPFDLPGDKPLILAAYSAGVEKVAYVEPLGVGDVLTAMPIFLEPELYIPAPLEATYMTTWNAAPEPLREAVETPP